MSSYKKVNTIDMTDARKLEKNSIKIQLIIFIIKRKFYTSQNLNSPVVEQKHKQFILSVFFSKK